MSNDVLLPATSAVAQYTSVVDGRKGGQQGHMANTRTWESSLYHTKQKLIAVLLQAPAGFRYLDDGDYYAALLKSAIETMATSITGLNQTTTMETEDTVQGYGGEVMQTPTLVSRSRSEPAMTFPELEGKPLTDLFRTIQTKLVMEPGTTRVGVMDQAAYIAAGSPPITAADRSFVTLFIEPNRSLTGVESAYMCANMMPIEVPDEISNEVGSPNEINNLEINFTALTIVNDSVKALALQYLNSINKYGYNPTSQTPFVTEVSPSLRDDALTEEGGSYSKAAAAAAARLQQ
ncbi:tail tube protein [Vibrio phage BONAISHI]|nr:tail tube protein [Vibrio phage BONAISHI]